MPKNFTDEKLAALDEAFEKLKIKRKAILAKHSAEARKNQTRAKAILGGWLLQNDRAMVDKIVAQLKRDQDKEVFAKLFAEVDAKKEPEGVKAPAAGAQ